MGSKCHVCGRVNADDDEHCAECGVSLEAAALMPDGTPSMMAISGATEKNDSLKSVPLDSAEPVSEKSVGEPVVCSSCGEKHGETCRFCSGCGARLKTPEGVETLSCRRCGAALEPNDRFCSSCGSSRAGDHVDSAEPPPARRHLSPPAGPVQFSLIVVTGHEKDREYPIDKDEAFIGRSGDNDVILNTDGYVSARHTRFFRTAEGCFVEDAGSTNGTFLRVRHATRLTSGDQVKIGQSIFRFEPGEE